MNGIEEGVGGSERIELGGRVATKANGELGNE